MLQSELDKLFPFLSIQKSTLKTDQNDDENYLIFENDEQS